jgi:hypothetical protein
MNYSKTSYNINQRELNFCIRQVCVCMFIYIVMYMPIARQQLGKHIPKGYAVNNRTSIARWQANKHAFLTRENSGYCGVHAKEAGLSTSTMALWVVGGDKNGTQCLGI